MYQGNFSGSKKFVSESGEAMPAAIITGIVTTILLLGITIVMSMVLQTKSDETDDTELFNNASNIDISLRSDITQATQISPSVKLKKPAGRLLTAEDIIVNGVILDIPESTGECKVIKWSVEGAQASRNLTIYSATTNQGSYSAKCDKSSEVAAQRTKTFPDSFLLQSPFTFNNHVGHNVHYSLTDVALTTINDELDNKLVRNDTNRLSDSDFDALNKLLTEDSVVAGFTDPSSCVMNAEKVESVDGTGSVILDSSGQPVMVCPPAETVSVASAWVSTSISTVSVNFDLIGKSGDIAHRQIEQTSSIPLR
jgi:hypothetical protein